jgi:hypothetical protein
MPTRCPSVTLDETGKCNYCRSFEEKYPVTLEELTRHLRQRFEELLDRHRGKHLYDALVPISGGKDSMYVLFVASRVFDLNVLAYNLDNGFQSQRATDNMLRAVQKLGVDFIVYKPREDVMLKLMHIFLSRAGEFCSPCNMLIGAEAQRLARQNGTPLIMTGSYGRRSAGIDGVSQSIFCDRRYYFNVANEHLDRREFEHYVAEPPLRIALKRLAGRAAESIDVLNYLQPDTQDMVETLERELGWESPSEEYEHGDCIMNPLKDYLQYRKWGCTELTQAYSALIRNGEMDREEALRRIEAEEIRNPPIVLDTFLERIGMTREEFEETKERHFTDFENYQTSGLYRSARKTWRSMRRVV